jgi:hypothetical protein
MAIVFTEMKWWQTGFLILIGLGFSTMIFFSLASIVEPSTQNGWNGLIAGACTLGMVLIFMYINANTKDAGKAAFIRPSG